MAARRMMGGAMPSPGIPGNVGMPGGRMPALPPRPGMMGASGGAANNPKPGMPGPQSGAMGGAMGAPVPPPALPGQPTAGGPMSPMNVAGSGMLTPGSPSPGPDQGGQPGGLPGAPPPAPEPLPPWGSASGATGTPGTSYDQQQGQGKDDLSGLLDENGKPTTPNNPNASESMSPMVMLRLLKSMGRI